MSDKWTLLKDKPYDFVPLISKIEKKGIEKGHLEFSKDKFSGRLGLSLTVMTPLHIGSGLFGKCNDGIAKLSMRRNNKFIIPGSTMKGVIRSICEAVSKSCAPQLPGKSNFKNNLSTALPFGNNSRCNNKESLCITCQMFGIAEKNESYKSKISFGEFSTNGKDSQFEKIKQLQSPFRDYQAGYRDMFGEYRNFGNERIYYCNICKESFNEGVNENCNTCTKDNYYNKRKLAGVKRTIKFRGRKFYYHSKKIKFEDKKRTNIFENYEFIKEGVKFSGNIIFENLSYDELSLLVFSLGLDGTFSPKVGYGKPLYFGSVKIELDSVEDYFNHFDELKERKNYINNEKIINMAREHYDKSNDELKYSINVIKKVLNLDNSNGPDWRDGY